MKRDIDIEIEGERFSCSKCGNINFNQDCYIKASEIVNIVRKDKKMTIVTIGLNDIKEEQIEYDNSFKCPKCNTLYEINKVENEDLIYDVGECDENE